MRNVDKVAENVTKAVMVTVEGWELAIANARSHTKDGLKAKAARYDTTGSGGSGLPGSTTETAALANASSRDRTADLNQALRRLDDAAADLHSLIRQLTPPTRRPGACANEGGCPDSSAAAREGLCHRCWNHHHQYQRPRTLEDIKDRIDRRKARHAEQMQQWRQRTQ